MKTQLGVHTFKSACSTFLISALLAAFAFVAHTKSWSGPFHGRVTAERRVNGNAVRESESRLASRRMPHANSIVAGSRRNADRRIARAAECISQGCGEP